MENSSRYKFRAWDKAKNEIVVGNKREMSFFGPEYEISDDGYIKFFSPAGLSPLGDYGTDRFILMQYTGLKDKNGKEIYEGDIVATSTVLIDDGWHNPPLARTLINHQIRWNNEKASWRFTDGEDQQIGHLTHHMEIIGNIYENPELLK